MARTPILDELLSHEFHLIDVDIQPPFNPPLVLWPTAGFSSISAPEMSFETETIVDGTSNYTHQVIKKASMSNMVLSKGVSMYNSDFWRWSVGVLSGHNERELGLTASIMPIVPAKRRNLMLIHSSGLSPKGVKESIEIGSIMEKIKGALLLPAAAITATVSAGISLLTEGTFDLNMLGVPGRAYMLFDCFPVRYKAAGDFDATSTAVSIEELEITYSRFELLGAFG